VIGPIELRLDDLQSLIHARPAGGTPQRNGGPGQPPR
jgi:hypothetical protein